MSILGLQVLPSALDRQVGMINAGVYVMLLGLGFILSIIRKLSTVSTASCRPRLPRQDGEGWRRAGFTVYSLRFFVPHLSNADWSLRVPMPSLQVLHGPCM